MNSKGFTLMELLVAIAIMGIAFAISVPQYSKYINSRALSLARGQVVGDIRMAQSHTMNTLKANGGFPEGGYGVRFAKDSNVYIIFADNDGDKIYKADGSEKFQEMEISGGVKINSLKVKIDSAETEENSADLIFVPPYGVTYINTVNKSGLGNFINLEIEIINKNNDTKTITARSSGLVN